MLLLCAGADTKKRDCMLEKTKLKKNTEPLLRSTHRGNVKCLRLQHFSSKNLKETNVLGRSGHKWVHIYATQLPWAIVRRPVTIKTCFRTVGK